MICFQGTTEFYSETPTAITLGKFDGLHRGHQKLLRQIREQKKAGLSAAVFIIAPEGKQRLLTDQEELEKLEEFGADLVIFCPFVPEILMLEAEEFVRTVLKEQLKAKYIAVGTDFHFGRNRRGDSSLLEQLSGSCGFRLSVVDKECWQGREISSSYVREAIQNGDMPLAERLLGYSFYTSGEVLHGRALGRTIGIPTVNLLPEGKKLLPPFGVYFSNVYANGNCYHGTTNIGVKPTVGGTLPGVETYLHDFFGDLYGEHIRVDLLKMIRAERRFSSIEALKQQMEQDIAAGEAFANER